MTYFLHPGAEQDVANALDFYAEHGGLLVASRFFGEFERVADPLVEHPGFGTPAARGRRVFPLRVFPYSAVYRSLEGRHPNHRRPASAQKAGVRWLAHVDRVGQPFFEKRVLCLGLGRGPLLK